MLSAPSRTATAAGPASVASETITPLVKVALTIGETSTVQGCGDVQALGVDQYLKAMGLYVVKGSKTARAFFFHIVACLKQPRGLADGVSTGSQQVCAARPPA